MHFNIYKVSELLNIYVYLLNMFIVAVSSGLKWDLLGLNKELNQRVSQFNNIEFDYCWGFTAYKWQRSTLLLA